jgi:polysaccharide biosynthesis protein PelB
VNNDRACISPLWLSGTIGVGIALALATAYPRGDMEPRQLAALPPSLLSAAYLEAWLRIEPDSPEYLNLLATQYLGLGNWDAVQRTADKLATLGNDAIRRRALLMQVTAAERQAYAVKPDDAQRPERMERYIGLLEQTIQHEWDLPIMRSLAEKARAAGATTVMLHYYRKLAATDTADATQWHEKLGDAAFARQSYIDAAHAYFAAQDAAETQDAKRRYFIAALIVLESGNQIGLACDEGEGRAGSLAEDPQTLRYLLGLARRAARADLMARYARALAKSANPERSSTRDEVFEASPDVQIVHAWPAPMCLETIA